MIDVHRIKAAMGGDVKGNSVLFPSPGHSAKDRGCQATVIPGAPDGFLIRTFNGADVMAVKREVMEKLGLSRGRPADAMTAREREETSRRREVEQRAKHEAAAIEAERLWASGAAPDPAHPYLERKNLAGEGLRQKGNRLLVPMRDIGGRLWSVQRIAPDGFKAFLPGARTSELMCIVGGGGDTACVGEGYATVGAVRRATGLPVVAAITGNNLVAVALAVRHRWPDLDLIICADDDAHLVDNPNIRKNLGLEYANAAAAAVGGRVAVPPQGEE